jgi:hypothetical protein
LSHRNSNKHSSTFYCILMDLIAHLWSIVRKSFSGNLMQLYGILQQEMSPPWQFLT